MEWKRRIVVTAFLAGSTILSAPANAEVLFEHTFAASAGTPVLCSVCERGGIPQYGPYRVWDRFVLNTEARVEMIESQRSISPFAVATSTFNFEVWNEPRDAILFSETISAAQSILDPAGFGSLLNVTSDVTDFFLPAGRYYLSIVGRNQADDDAGWGLSPVTVDGFGYQTQDLSPFGQVTTENFDAAFRLLGARVSSVSEPEILWLFIVALLGIALNRRRERDCRRRV